MFKSREKIHRSVGLGAAFD